MKHIEWQPNHSSVLTAVVADSDLWFSHKTLSKLFEVTTQNISLHIRDLSATGLHSEAREFLIKQSEGTRSITRHIKHFPFQVAHAIALRSQHFDQLNDLVELAQRESVLRPLYRIVPVKERNFAGLLIGALNKIANVIPQYPVGSHFVDFFLPVHRIVIEYDEKHHEFPRNRARDNERQRYIERELGAKFIRVSQGEEVAGLNAVLREILLIKGAI